MQRALKNTCDSAHAHFMPANTQRIWGGWYKARGHVKQNPLLHNRGSQLPVRCGEPRREE